MVERSIKTMRFENDGSGVEQTDAQIKIISESGVQAFGQIKVGYSALSEKLDIAYVRVRKPDGTVVTAQESAVQDLTFADAPVYTDYHIKDISVPSLRPGDVLEYRFVKTIASPLAPGQFWTSYTFAEHGVVLDEDLEINVPKDRQIKLKSKPGYDAKITEEGDRRIYRWTHSRLKNDYDSDKKNKKKKADDEVPSVQLTTFKSWEELGAWYASLERERRIPDESVKKEAAALVKGKSDNMAKVKALYEYVSRNIRYVSLSFGLGRIQPHAASEVLANGYGDCKDKNTLLAALLDCRRISLDLRADRLEDQARPGHSITIAIRSRHNPRAGRWQGNLAGQHPRRGAVPHVVSEPARQAGIGNSTRRPCRTGMDTVGDTLCHLRSNQPGGHRQRYWRADGACDHGIARRHRNDPTICHAPDAQQPLERHLRLHVAARQHARRGDYQPEGQRSQCDRRTVDRRVRRYCEQLFRLVGR